MFAGTEVIAINFHTFEASRQFVSFKQKGAHVLRNVRIIQHQLHYGIARYHANERKIANCTRQSKVVSMLRHDCSCNSNRCQREECRKPSSTTE